MNARNFKLASALVASSLFATSAFASPVTLDFEGASSFASIADFYNGGTDGDGASGINVGVLFGGDAAALSNDELGPYFSNAPTPGTVMTAFGSDAALNVGVGFSGEASFFYSASEATSVGIFSGLNGTGDLLGSFQLLANAQNGCSDTGFCHWDFISMTFSGVAQSIQFGEAAFVAAFDNVTVAPVPLPAAGWLLLSAIGGLGAVSRRRTQAAGRTVVAA